MKKIYVPMMLAFSLYSANAYEPPMYTHSGQYCEDFGSSCRHLVDGMPNWLTVYGDDIGVSSHKSNSDGTFFKEGDAGDGRPYTIYNNRGKKIKGFKFYHYFNAQPSGKFNVKVYHYFNSYRNDQGLMYRDDAIQPDTIIIERLSAIQYRAILDYSSDTIVSGARFPEEGAFYVRVSSTESKNGKKVPVTGWASEGHELKGFAITDPSGKVLYGPKLNNEGKREFPTIDNLRRVGILIKNEWQYCPSSNQYGPVSQYQQENPPTIRLDAEDDDDPATRIVDKDGNTVNTKPVGISITGDKNVVFRFCAVDTVALPQARYDYAVLSLDSECPEGSYRVSRKHDTENDENANSYSGQIWPNKTNYDNHNAKLYYCFVPKNSSAPSYLYPFVDGEFGVFGRYSNSIVDYRKLIIDDEDDDNSNVWKYYSAPSDIKNRIKKLMNGNEDTGYYILQQKVVLSKSAAEVAEGPIPVEKTLVAATPLAPAIKGLNRSTVAVELKTSGNVKVSIVNINGSVVANIAQENLQSGIHQLKWNSGAVPNGRYVVKVEQNGMVNAKNVILK